MISDFQELLSQDGNLNFRTDLDTPTNQVITETDIFNPFH